MLRNYLLVALRSIRANLGFALINVVGLAFSMALALLLAVFLRSQATQDSFHADADRIYRFYSDFKASFNADNALYATSPAPLAGLLEQQVPGVERVARIRSGFSGTAVVDGSGFSLSGFYADPAFFDLFDIELAEGDPATALAQPRSVVLSPAAAVRFFGNERPVGQSLTVGHDVYDVTGVLKDIPYNTHFPLETIASFATLTSDSTTRALLGDWTQSIYRSYTYVRLEPGADPSDVEQRVNALIPVHFAEHDNNRLYGLHIQPLTAINLGKIMGNQLGATFPIEGAYVLVILTVVILLIASFNYVGLTTARALRRVREVGVRKVFGARRPQLIAQFILESIVISLLSVGVAGLILLWLVPAFNSLSFARMLGLEVAIDMASDPGLFGVFLAVALGVALVAGAYPALFLSRFKPVRVLRGTGATAGGGSFLRKGLVVAQFTVSIVFIIYALTIRHQTAFMARADYGYDPEGVVNVDLFDVPFERFRTALAASANVELISGTDPLPSLGSRRDRWMRPEGIEERFKGYEYLIDEHFLDNLEIDLLAGRNLTPDIAGDREGNVLVNAAAARKLGFARPEEAVDQSFILGDSTLVTIVGVVEDYNADTLQQGVLPIVLRYRPDALRWANVRVAPGRMDAAVADIERAWTAMGHPRAATYEAFTSQLANSFLMAQQKDLMRLIGFIAVLAVLIACLGLLGITSHNVERRAREISIRKVLGADVRHVVMLLSREFAFLFGLAAVLATPVAWFVSNTFLNVFAVRPPLGAGVFVGGIALIAALALLTTGSQTVRAALANPVNNLGQE